MPLWLDESGDFADPLDTVVVGGVIVSEQVGNGPVKAALRRLCPGWPWPLHAAHLRHEVSLALASVAARRLDPTVRTPVDADADTAIEVVRFRESTLVDAALDELDAGRLPSYNTVARLNIALKIAVHQVRLAPEVVARLEIARDEWARAMAHTASALPSACGVTSLEHEQGVAGGSYLRRAGVSEKIGASATHRYFGLLGPALARAASLRSGDSQPAPCVASRWVHDVRGLGNEDLLRVSRLYTEAEGTRLKPPQVVRYDRSAPALLVVADFVANAARRAVIAGEDPLERTLLTATGLSFETTSEGRRMSHVVRVGGEP
jgi:hypothetical protein